MREVKPNAHESRMLRRMLPQMRQSERVSAILEELSEDGSVGVAELATRCTFRAATIRRDLVLLEEQRLLARTHGGAVPHGCAVRVAAPLQGRAAPRREAPDRARRPRRGSPTERRSDSRAARPPPRSHARWSTARGSPSSRTRSTSRASWRSDRTSSSSSPAATRARSPTSWSARRRAGPRRHEPRRRVCRGRRHRRLAGCTTHHEVEAHTNFALIERARRVVVVADGSKVGQVAFARICAVDRVSRADHRSGAGARRWRRSATRVMAVETV